MDTEANNMRVPEDIEGTDFECENLDDMGLGEDVDAIEADEDDDLDLNEDEMENPISKSDADDDDDDDEDDGYKKAYSHNERGYGVKKSDDDDDDDADEDDDDKLKKQVAKGGLTQASLNKSIANLARYAQAADPEARKKSIMRRAMLGKSLSKSERSILMQHLNGTDERTAPSRSLSKGMANNPGIQGAVDVSEYVAQLNNEMVKALNTVERRMAAMAQQNTEFQLLLAKAVAQTGQGVMALNKSVAAADAAPVRGPKSMGVTGRSRPLQKSGMGPSLTKAQAEEAIDALLVKSRRTGRYGFSESGADLLKASTHFESSNGQLLPEVQADVARYIRENR